MSDIQSINCNQLVDNYCNGGYDPSLYSSYDDCINNKKCSDGEFPKCGDGFDQYISLIKRRLAKKQGVTISDLLWYYSPSEEYEMYASWNAACDSNVNELHDIALVMRDGYNFSGFLKELLILSGGLSKSFVEEYQDELFQTYRSRTLPTVVIVKTKVDAKTKPNVLNTKVLIVVGVVAMALMYKK